VTRTGYGRWRGNFKGSDTAEVNDRAHTPVKVQLGDDREHPRLADAVHARRTEYLADALSLVLQWKNADEFAVRQRPPGEAQGVESFHAGHLIRSKIGISPIFWRTA